jgi:uncharacterized protein (DUF1684 family)
MRNSTLLLSLCVFGATTLAQGADPAAAVKTPPPDATVKTPPPDATVKTPPSDKPAKTTPNAVDPAYIKSVQDWRKKAEEGLKRDNGWLTLAGRYPLKAGENTFGTGPGNDVVFPPGLGPAGMGSVFVKPGKVVVKMVEGLALDKDGIKYTEREMETGTDVRDWVTVGPRASFHVFELDGQYILRLADKQSPVREHFGGRVWYPVDQNFRSDNARFVPYPPGRKITIVNVLGRVSQEPVAGYVEFDIDGHSHRLDALTEDDGLFIIFKDNTAGDTTYGSGRFMYVEKMPEPGKPFRLDFNRAYNPPCAFSEFTTCPLPPKQNILDVSIEAGEKYPPKKKG